MKDINVFLIKNENSQNSYLESNIKKQLKESGLSYSIKKYENTELPAVSDSAMTVLLLENSVISKTYFNDLLCLRSIVKDFSILCGNVQAKYSLISQDVFTKSIMKYCHSYHLSKYSKNLVCDITLEPDNFPPSYNIAINSTIYNERGGITPIHCPKGFINDDRAFVLSASKFSKIIHCDSLSTSVELSDQDLSLKSISNYFYQQGFLAAMNIKFKKMPHFERIWKQFVETPESLDHRVLGRLTFTLNDDSEQSKIFAEKIAMVKCSYQSGLFEGLSGITL
tara:strand:- start:8972 stop:9814 length:843 start_codon:yes stop_codon:yes gene_type:complete